MPLRPSHLLCALLAVSTSCLTAGSASAVTAVSPGGSAMAAAPCGVVDQSSLLSTGRAAVPLQPQTLISGLNVSGLAVSGQDVVVHDSTSGALTTFSQGDPARSSSRVVPEGSVVVDPSGTSYGVSPPYDVVKRSPDGTVLWRQAQDQPVSSLFGVSTPGGWRLGAVRGTGSVLLAPDTGQQTGTAGVEGQVFASTADGGLLSTDGQYVRTYDSTFAPGLAFGAGAKENVPMPEGAPLHFYQLGSAVRLADGRFLVADATKGIWLVSGDGLVRGLVPDAALGGLTQQPLLAVASDRLYYSSGARFTSNQSIRSLALRDVVAAAQAPGVQDPRLGFGAGISTGVAGNYFLPGSSPALSLTLDPWWSRLSGLQLSYTVRSAGQVSRRVVAPTRTLPLDGGATAGVRLQLGPVSPGAFEVDARLLLNGVAVSGTCVHYTVGRSGDQLDMTHLIGTADAGGPDGPRGVQLADALGTGGHRLAMTWENLLDPAGNITFAHYDDEVRQAAAEARLRGVRLSVQLGSGGPERRFVDDGSWEARVRTVVAHWAPEVDYWEAWNEPNISFGNASDYVSKVLAPFSRAVHTADPGGQVIGASLVGMGDYPYWQQIADLGGFQMMDVVGIHPYTGHNRSWEEEGVPSKIAQLRAIMQAAGRGDLPIMVTEFAFWSNGPANWFGQADHSARAMIWNKALGLSGWDYFLTQGTWGNDGVSFSAIEGNDIVKPAALALMETKRELAGRPFQGFLDTGTPHTYAASFGSRAGAQDQTVALWSDDGRFPLAMTTATTGRVRLSDQYGAQTWPTLSTAPTQVIATGSVQYVTLPRTQVLSLRPLEAWGTDLAGSAAGGTASATSSGPWNDASLAIDGITDAHAQGDYRSSPAWASAVGDGTPELTVALAAPTTVDRVVFSTSSIGSVLPGIRDADVLVQSTDGTWRTVGRVRKMFFDRTSLTQFAPVLVRAVKLRVLSVDYGGYAGGGKPWFWTTDPAELADPTSANYGPAIVRELEVYGSPAGAPATTAPDADLLAG